MVLGDLRRPSDDVLLCGTHAGSGNRGGLPLPQCDGMEGLKETPLVMVARRRDGAPVRQMLWSRGCRNGDDEELYSGSRLSTRGS